MTEEAKKNQNKFLVAAVILLSLGLAFETGYLLKSRNSLARSMEPRQALQAGKQKSFTQSAPAGPGHAWFDDSGNSGHWDPFVEMDRMQEHMNRMFNESFRHAEAFTGLTPGNFGMSRSFFEPDIDLQDKKDHYLLIMDIPGMEKDQLNIAVKNHVLTVSGERKIESENRDSQQGFYSMERRLGSFTRTIPLPEDANAEQIRAGYERGELRIEIPKLPQTLPAANTRKVSVQ